MIGSRWSSPIFGFFQSNPLFPRQLADELTFELGRVAMSLERLVSALQCDPQP